MDPLFALTLALRWLHLLSSIILVGGLFHLRFAVLPAVETLPREHQETFHAALRRSWTIFVMAAIGLLLVTGLVNMVLVPKLNDFQTPEGKSAYNMLVGIKFVLALPVFFIVSTLNGRSANAERFRQKSRMWLNIAIVLSLAIVLIGGYVRFIPRTPKKAENAVGQAAVGQAFLPAGVPWGRHLACPCDVGSILPDLFVTRAGKMPTPRFRPVGNPREFSDRQTGMSAPRAVNLSPFGTDGSFAPRYGVKALHGAGQRVW
jgi:uncharacterized membrane protein